MHDTLKKIGKHSAIFALGNLLSKAIGFLLIPMYTAYLTPADYGILEMLIVTLEIVILISALGMGNGLIKAYSFDYENEVQRKEAISTAYYFVIIVSFVVFGILIVFSESISLTLVSTTEYTNLFVLLFITGIVKISNIIPFRLLRAKLESVKYITINLTGFVIAVTLNIYFIAFLKKGIAGIIYSDLISSSVVFIINLILIRKSLIWGFSKEKLKGMLRFSLPFVPTTLMYQIIVVSDRYFLEHLSTTHELGLYSLGNKFASILQFVFIAPFATVWPSIFFPLAKKDSAKEELSRIFTYFLFIGTFLALGLSLFADVVIKTITTPGFHTAYKVVPLLVISIIFYGIYMYVSAGISISGKTEYLLYVTCMAAMVNLILNYLLIPSHGMMGAAYATLIAQAAMCILSFAVSTKLYPIKYEYNRILKNLLAFTGLLAIYFFTRPESLISASCWIAVLCIGYIVSLYAFNFFTEEEINGIRKIFRERSFKFNWVQ